MIDYYTFEIHCIQNFETVRIEVSPQIKFTKKKKKINEEYSHLCEINQNVHLFNVVRGEKRSIDLSLQTFITINQDQRIADTGWDPWRSSHPPPLLNQGHLHPRSLSRCLSNVSKDEDTTACLGNLCQFLLTVKKCFLMLRRNLLCSSLCHWLLSCHWTDPGSIPSSHIYSHE